VNKNGPTKPPVGLNGSATAAKPRAPQAPVAAAAPPPKGSFAELMARAKALQNTKLGQGPKIMHKATTKSKEDPRDRKKELDPKGRGKPSLKGRPVSRSGSEGPARSSKAPALKTKTKGAKIVPEKPKRKPVEVSYKGTMRPNPAAQPAYRGTGQLKAPAGRDRDRYGRRYSDEDDEDEEDYDSDASSDMEAGAWDIDEEEDFALRKAKAEDAAAKREEEEHKRRKLLLKQGLGDGGARRRL
jgi:protein SPT2